MNGVSRFLSGRGKRGKDRGSVDGRHHLHKDSYRIFHVEDREKRKSDREEEKKVKALLKRVEDVGITDLKDTNIEYALRSPSVAGNSDKAFELLMLYRDAVHGSIRAVNPDVHMVGAINREYVTCYLDSLLFAMFGRVDSFERILSDNNTLDHEKKELAVVLRLWINMLRTGKLITVDIVWHFSVRDPNAADLCQTQRLQETLKECGWPEAALLRQQDVSEAFTFITGQLNLPLLTLKMDVYHTGKEDKDDHRIVRERLLEVSISEPPEDGSPIKLEDCLENYFNNKIEVKRHLQRRATLSSIRPGSMDKGQVLHVETAEIRPGSPSSMRASDSSPVPPGPSLVRPVNMRTRADSIFSQRNIDDAAGKKTTHDDIGIGGRPRNGTGTMRKEVLMSAWQFFSLIPWNNIPETPATDAQVAQQLQTQRPVLGICLKRYMVDPQGNATRLNTHIDIPLEMGIPHFIDDSEPSGAYAANFTNFKLSLQSVICHRGKSLDAGHYISLVRDHVVNSVDNPANAPWLRFDDLAKDRVAPVNIHEALKEETPYLLFYQVQPIDEVEAEDTPNGAPPTYDEVVAKEVISLTTVPTNSDSDTTATTDSSSLQTNPSAKPSTLDVNLPSATVPKPSMLDLPPSVREEERTNSADTIKAPDSLDPLPQITNTIEKFVPPTTDTPTTTTSTTSIPAILTKAPTLPSLPFTNSSPLLSHTTDISATRPKSINLAELATQTKSRSSLDLPGGRNSFQSSQNNGSERRSSVAFTEPDFASSKGGSSAPLTPGEEGETKTSYLATSNASRRNSVGKSWGRRSKSRPTSQSGENRLSMSGMGGTMTRLRNAMSKDKLGTSVHVEELVGGDLRKEKEKEKEARAKEEEVKGNTGGRSKSARHSYLGGKDKDKDKDKDGERDKKRRSSSVGRKLGEAIASGSVGIGNGVGMGKGSGNGNGKKPERECVVM
ncbi:cysteine proteinase [Tothia fuscella]|uniref:ubiquitinyl hydrolase 1 n=1 Tax=Tothia fuscella TaxID=1048955 RepID=A0A9P4NNG3_9PEZI|nr:cysteine proteinase [Tothia fuscella]